MASAKEVKQTNNIQEDPFVTIRIPRESPDQEDVVVWVNDKRYLIKRGVAVTVPSEVAFVLEKQEDMMETIYRYQDKMSK